MNKLLAGLAVLSLSACAQNAQEISAAYTSPETYADFSCRQVYDESRRVSARTTELAGVQDKQAQDDAAATAVALILFWPAAFLINGDDETAHELARLKGQMEALEEVNTAKKCGIVFRADPADSGEKTETTDA